MKTLHRTIFLTVLLCANLWAERTNTRVARISTHSRTVDVSTHHFLNYSPKN